MFITTTRNELLGVLVDAARGDDDVVAAALVGSGATGSEDEWSDIDLAFRIRAGTPPQAVAERWTSWLYREHGAAHHVDIVSGTTLYRVFLLRDSLQVDLSFWTADEFRATEPGFRLLFGEANAPTVTPSPDSERAAGMGWLYALHSRSAIARGRLWQADIMLAGIRDQIITLACIRHGLNPYQGRGVDRLPAGYLDLLQQARPTSFTTEEFAHAHEHAVSLLLEEITQHQPALAQKLIEPASHLAKFPVSGCQTLGAVEPNRPTRSDR